MEIKLENLFYPVPSQSDPDIQLAVYRRSDLWPLRAKSGDITIPSVQGNYFNHQVIVHQLMSTYDRMLLIHETGTGKSCSSAGLAELLMDNFLEPRHSYADEYLKNKISHIRRAVILVSGKTLAEEFRRHIVCVCSRPGKYMGRSARSVTNELKKFYKIKGYIDFYSSVERELVELRNFLKEQQPDTPDWKISELAWQEIVQEYSDTLFIFDEVHNIGFHEGKENRDTLAYNFYHRLFHEIQRSKVMLLSATPMSNYTSEVVPIMNLILPLSRQIRIPRGFGDTFSSYLGMSREEFAEKFRGYVSYVRKPLTNIRIEEEGITYNLEMNLDDEVKSKLERYEGGFPENYQIRVYPVRAVPGGLQERTFLSSETDFTATNAFLNASRKISNFVFPAVPEEGWQVGYDNYTYDLWAEQDRLARSRGEVGRLTALLANPQRLRESSAKFAELLKLARGAKNNIFIFSNFVRMGALLIGRMFEAQQNPLDHYSPFNIDEVDRRKTPGYCGSRSVDRLDLILPKKRRFAVISPESTENSANISTILEIFNHRDNRYGDYIKIIIASPIGREGINLNNTTLIHNVDSEWKDSKMYQAFSRAIRITSFQYLEQPVTVKIYRHVIYFGKELTGTKEDIDLHLSSDLFMADVSSQKMAFINQAMDVMRESSIDAYLNYNINHDEPSPELEALQPDEFIHMSSSLDKTHADRIVQLMGESPNSVFTLREISLRARLDQITVYQVLNRLITDRTEIYDRYGNRCRIDLSGQHYYLSRDFGFFPPADKTTWYSDNIPLSRQDDFLETALAMAYKANSDELDGLIEAGRWRELVSSNFYAMIGAVENWLARGRTLTGTLTKYIFAQGNDHPFFHDLSKLVPRPTAHGNVVRELKPGTFQRVYDIHLRRWRNPVRSELPAISRAIKDRYRSLSQANDQWKTVKVYGRENPTGRGYSVINTVAAKPGDKRTMGNGRQISSIQLPDKLKIMIHIYFNVDGKFPLPEEDRELIREYMPFIENHVDPDLIETDLDQYLGQTDRLATAVNASLPSEEKRRLRDIDFLRQILRSSGRWRSHEL